MECSDDPRSLSSGSLSLQVARKALTLQRRQIRCDLREVLKPGRAFARSNLRGRQSLRRSPSR